MAKLVEFELVADKEVKRGEKAGINSLFAFPELDKGFDALVDFLLGIDVKVSISKMDSLLLRSDVRKEKGRAVKLWELLGYSHRDRQFTATQDVSKGEKLKVAVETA